MRPPEEAGTGGFHLVIVHIANRPSCDNDYIPTWRNSIHLPTHCFTESTFNPVAYNGGADPAVHRKAKPAVVQLIGKYTGHSQFIGVCATLLTYLLETSICAHTETTLHHALHTALHAALHGIANARSAVGICSPVNGAR